MNKQKFKNSLQNLAESAIPDDQQAWKAIHQRIPQESMQKKQPRLRWVFAMASVVLVVVVVLAFTPAGEALAKMMQNTSIPPERPPSPLNICYEEPWGYACQVLQAEERSGFDAKEFPGELENFELRDIPVANSDTFIMEYTYHLSGGGFLYFRQSTDTSYNSYTTQAPENTVQEVRVGENRGEFVRGRYTFWGDLTSYSYIWSDGFGARLQWSDGEYWYEIDVQSMLAGHENYNNSDYLIDLALSLVDESAEIRQLRLQTLTDLDEIDAVTEFDIVYPSLLPESFSFSYGSYDEPSSQLTLHYSPENQSHLTELLITETPLVDVSQQDSTDGRLVLINGKLGRYISDSSYSHTVIWQTEDLQIMVTLNVYDEAFGIGFKRREFLQIARSLQ